MTNSLANSQTSRYIARFVATILSVIVFSLISASVAFAQNANGSAAAPAKPSGVGAVVRSDEAIVYSQPDFDASTIGTLAAGTRVRVSKGVTGGYVKFHKVRVGPQIGYIADIDVTVEGMSEGEKDELNRPKDGPVKKKHSRFDTKDKSAKKKTAKKKKREQEPIIFTHYVGLAFGETWFKEGIDGVDASAGVSTYGLKITGPDVVLNGPIMDFNLLFHNGAPSYYNALSKTSPSGFLLFTDALFLLPFVQGQDNTFYFGAGPLLVLTDFKVFNSGHSQDLLSLNLGMSFALGYAVRFDKIAIRIEGKYEWERQSYRSVLASVQTEY